MYVSCYDYTAFRGRYSIIIKCISRHCVFIPVTPYPQPDYRKSKNVCVKRQILKLSCQKTFTDHIHRKNYKRCSLTDFKLSDVHLQLCIQQKMDDKIEEVSCMVITFITPFGIRVQEEMHCESGRHNTFMHDQFGKRDIIVGHLSGKISHMCIQFSE